MGQVLLLEEELHEPLFVRMGRRVKLTPAGESVLELSHRVLDDIRETSSVIHDKQKTLSGTLSMVGGMTVCLYVFPHLIKEFRKHHPQVDIKIAVGGTVRLQRLVRTHPVSGRKSLYLASHAGGIVGWPVPEARAFLRDLVEHATQREFVYAHRWHVNDLVMWDNRATMHRARPFPAHEPRDMRRTTLVGDGPTVTQAG